MRQQLRNDHRALRATLAAVGVVSFTFAGRVHADAITWQEQADFQAGSGNIPRSIRGIALSPDGSSEYVGWIQGTGSASTVLREYPSSSLVPVPGTNPPVTASVNLAGNQPKGVAVDDRGFVLTTYNNSAGATSQQFRIYDSALATLEATITTHTVGSATPFKYQLGGIATADLGGTHYAYVATNKGAATIERWNIENINAPTIDTSWASSGILNLQTTQGSSAFLNGLDVEPDGTIYATGGVLGTGRGDSVFKINADGSAITKTAVDQAMDVAMYQGDLYVAQYKANLSAVAVLDASSLASLGTLNPGFTMSSTDDTGFDGITVDSGGHCISPTNSMARTSAPETRSIACWFLLRCPNVRRSPLSAWPARRSSRADDVGNLFFGKNRSPRIDFDELSRVAIRGLSCRSINRISAPVPHAPSAVPSQSSAR